MAAVSGGERLDEAPAAMNSVIVRPDTVPGSGRARSLDEIFPLRGDASRGRQMQETWRAFGAEMGGAVRLALDGGRSPPEIAYAIGEIVHNYFRTRGVTLTSYELRRLVAELLAEQAGGGQSSAVEGPLVRFAGEPPAGETSWTGGEATAPGPAVPDVVFEGPPSRLVTVTSRDADAARLADVAAKVRARLASDPNGLARAAAIGAIDAVLGDALREEPQRRLRLARLVLSELCGLGPIDRLWADRSIGAVFVNGPDRIYVERNGLIEPSPERFHDQAQLEEIAGRLARRSASGVALVRLRDGSDGVVLFPPAAPVGPVLALRRGEPGDATFERLVSAGRLGRPMADLLRIATRSRLNVLVVGPEGAGKTTLLAAMARDLGDARIVTLARHRAFRWPSASKVELVATDVSFASVLAGGVQLRPDLLAVDLMAPDTSSFADLLSRGMRGVVAAGASTVLADLPRQAVDIVVRLALVRGGLSVVASMEDATGAPLFVHEDGECHRRTTAPSFAGNVQKAGYGEALASVLR